jgi:prepilin-type N-terminal cleavage/methylation domain-containing protein
MTRRRPENGFTLLEIMIALAVLAVGAICILSTFAAALALHMRREADVRTARVMEEARIEAQNAWDNWAPSKARPFPPALPDLVYSRDVNLGYSITYEAVPGQPALPDGNPGGVAAVVKVSRAGDAPERTRTYRILLVRSGFRAAERKESVTFEQEKEADKQKEKEKDSSGKGRKGPR